MIQPISVYSPNYIKKSNKTIVPFEAKEQEPTSNKKKMTVIGVVSLIAFWVLSDFLIDKIGDIKSEKEIDKMLAPLDKDLKLDGLEDVLKTGAKKVTKIVK